MALYATNRFAGDGTTTQYEINFVGQYIDRSHVKAYRVDNATQVRTPVVIAPGQWLNATTITGFAPTPVGQTLVIYRDTPKPPIVDFVNGSRFTEYNMDLVARQGLFVAMEALDAGDSEARQQLLDAIAVIVGLSDDATAAALAAATSASNALGSAQAAGAAQTGAETARDAANTSAANALGSANSASTSADNANIYAGNALASKNDAATSATNASTSETNALNSKNAAAIYATNAATSSTNASGYASTASTKAAEAATSATNAAAHATQAQTYANSINPATFVTLTGTQTVSGAKTFSIAPDVGNVADPAAATGKALNWASIRPRTIINGWGTQAGVTNNIVYMGWSPAPGGILAQVDSTHLGSVLTTSAARNQNLIGALVFGHYLVGGSSLSYGTQVAGYDLRAASSATFDGGALPGTWVCLGVALGNASGVASSAKTLFMRVS